jgi:hypothetical protein
MILGIAEDLTSTVELDSELTNIPDSGMYLNSGVHPSITVNNLLAFLPNLDFTFDAWSSGTTYSKFDTSRNRGDLVLYNTKVYQSILGTNLNQQPDISPTYWVETNIESLRVKTFIQKVKDKVYSELKLTRRLIDNQYLYSSDTTSTTTITLPNDYAGWVFEPKGSDYVSFRINEASLRAMVAVPTNLYVVNQGSLVTTIVLNPNNGVLAFEAVNYSFSGKGKWLFVIDSQDVKANGSTVDMLNYEGFVAYTASGIGASPQAATYTYGTTDNGLGFNITAYLDSSQYIDNNLVEYANYVKATFELMALEMFLHNSNNRSNLSERHQLDREMLIAETKELNAHSVIFKQREEKKRAIKQLEKTLDRNINDNDNFVIKYTSI